MKLKSKLIPVIACGLVACTPLAAITSCSCSGQQKGETAKATISGAEGITLDKTEFEKNKDLDIKMTTGTGNADVIKITTLKIGGQTLTPSQYKFETDINGDYHLIVEAKYVTGELALDVTRTPGVMLTPSVFDEDKQYITLISTRAEKDKDATFVAKLTEKGIQEKRKITLGYVSYYDEWEEKDVHLDDNQYSTTWDETNNELKININKENVNKNLKIGIASVIEESAIALNHYLEEESADLSGLSSATSIENPSVLQIDKEYTFKINTNDYPEEKRISEENFEWGFMVINPSEDGPMPVNLDTTNLEIKVGDHVLTSDEYELAPFNMGITGKGDFKSIAWGSIVQITVKLAKAIGLDEIACFPAFVDVTPRASGDVPVVLSYYSDVAKNEILGAKDMEGYKNFSTDVTYVAEFESQQWSQFDRPNKLRWNLQIVNDKEAHERLGIIDPENVTVAINGHELSNDDYGISEDKTTIFGKGDFADIDYKTYIIIKFKVTAEAKGLVTLTHDDKNTSHSFDLNKYETYQSYGMEIKGLTLSDPVSLDAGTIYTMDIELSKWDEASKAELGQLDWCLVFVKEDGSFGFTELWGDNLYSRVYIDNKEIAFGSDWTFEDFGMGCGIVGKGDYQKVEFIHKLTIKTLLINPNASAGEAKAYYKPALIKYPRS